VSGVPQWNQSSRLLHHYITQVWCRPIFEFTRLSHFCLEAVARSFPSMWRPLSRAIHEATNSHLGDAFQEKEAAAAATITPDFHLRLPTSFRQSSLMINSCSSSAGFRRRRPRRPEKFLVFLAVCQECGLIRRECYVLLCNWHWDVQDSASETQLRSWSTDSRMCSV
jgi:hypothetical protein